MSEFPHELIREFQIRTRAAAGLPDYDPTDSTLPALPSLAATIATLDPSPPHLRCKYCKGRLLVGSQSIICVYCGSRPQNDVVLDPICFNSTVGYRWLLQSLRLDGSELVKPPTNKTEKDQGQSSPKAEISLSDFLNFKLAWPAETEESKRSLNVTGVDPDNFFFKTRSDASATSFSAPVIPTQVWTTGMEKATTLGSQHLDHDIQSSETFLSSSEHKINEDFSAWEANFQSADIQNVPSLAKSSLHFTASEADPGSKSLDSLSFDSQFPPSIPLADSGNRVQGSQSFGHVKDSIAHMDSEFVNQKDPELQSGNNLIASSEFDQWDSDDLWKNLSSNKFRHDRGSAENNEALTHHPENGLINFEMSQDFRWQVNDSSMKENLATEPNAKSVTENTLEANKTLDEGSSDYWNDFTGSKQHQNPSMAMNQMHRTVNEDSFDEWNDFTGSVNLQDPSESAWSGSNSQLSTSHEKSSEVDLFSPSSGFGGDFSRSQDANLVAPSISSSNVPTDGTSSGNPASNSVDLFLDFLSQPNNTRIPENSTSDKTNKTLDEDSFDEWNNFAASNNLQDPSMKTDEVPKTVVDDSFDEWDYFAASTKMQDPSGSDSSGNNSQPSPLQEKPLETEFQSFQSQPNNTRIPENSVSDEVNKKINEDSFGDWNGFAGSNNLQNPSVTADEVQKKDEANKTLDEDSFDDWNDFAASNNLQDPSMKTGEVHKTVVDDSFDEWDYFSASTKIRDPSGSGFSGNNSQPSSLQEKSSETEFQSFQSQPNNTRIPENSVSDEVNKKINADSFGDWNDFAGSNNLRNTSGTADEVQKTVVADSVDEWNYFTDSAKMQGRSGSSFSENKYQPSLSLKKSSETEFQEFPLQPVNSRIPENLVSDKADEKVDEDSFDDWNDFTSSSNLKDPSVSTNEVHKAVDEDSYDEWNYFSAPSVPSGSASFESKYQPSPSDKKSETEFQALQLQTDNTRLPGNSASDEVIKKDDADSFDDWNDFTGSNNLQGSSVTTEKADRTVDEYSFDEWNYFTASANKRGPSGIAAFENKNQPSPSQKKPSESEFQDVQMQPDSARIKEDMASDEANKTADEDSFGDWNVYTGSSNQQDTSLAMHHDHKMVVEDSFDEWNDFTASNNIQDPSGSNYQPSMSHKQPSEMESFAQSSRREGDFSNFPEINLNSTSTTNNNIPAEATLPENPTFNSIDSFLEFQWQPANTSKAQKTSGDKSHKVVAEDSFDQWNDFTGQSPSTMKDASERKYELPKTVDEDSFDEWGDFAGSPDQQDHSGSNYQPPTTHKKSSGSELISQQSGGFEGAFSGFLQTDPVSISNRNNAISTENPAINSFDFFQGFDWQPGTTSMTENTTGHETRKNVDEDSFDEWNDYTASTDLKDSSGTIGEVPKIADETSFDEWNDFTGSNNVQDPSGTTDRGNKPADEDSFGELNIFMGPTNLQDSSGSSLFRSNGEFSTSHKKSPEIDLFSSNMWI